MRYNKPAGGILRKSSLLKKTYIGRHSPLQLLDMEIYKGANSSTVFQEMPELGWTH